MKFLLIEVIERNISDPMHFDTFEEAHAKMEKCFFEANGCDPENYDPSDLDGVLAERIAWCENSNHDNCDWKIFEMK